MRKRTFLFALLCFITLLGVAACNNDSEPLANTLVVRNVGEHNVMLQSVVVNGQAYLNADFTLAPADKSVPVTENDFTATFKTNGSVTVEIALYDAEIERNVKIEQTFESLGEFRLVRVLYTQGELYMFAL